MTDQPRSGADILAEIKPTIREGVAHVCMRPDLIDEWEKANEELMRAQSESPGQGRLANGTTAATKKLAQNVRDLEDQIEAADVAFRFRKISKTRHSEICDENPPRDGNLPDWQVGYNREAVDNQVVYESLVDPVFAMCAKKGCKHDGCGTWEALLKVLGPGEWSEMAAVVRDINGAVSTTPKSVLASAILDRPASGSRRRARSE